MNISNYILRGKYIVTTVKLIKTVSIEKFILFDVIFSLKLFGFLKFMLLI